MIKTSIYDTKGRAEHEPCEIDMLYKYGKSFSHIYKAY